MKTRKMSTFRWGICALAVLFGCCVMNGSAHAQKAAGPDAGAVYSPKLPAGLTTPDAVKKHMEAQYPCIKIYGQPGINHLSGKAALRGLAQKRYGTLTYDSKDELLFMCLGAHREDFLEDRIEWNPGILF